jgi:hypothetical protein
MVARRRKSWGQEGSGHLVLKYGLMILSLLVVSHGTTVAADRVCRPIKGGKLQCTITTVSDCEALSDYPYARNLFCPAAFSAVQTMVSRVEKTLGVNVPTRGFFYYYQIVADPQAPPDDQAQTTIACLDTLAPYPSGSKFVKGAGTPLCHLIAYTTSPGRTDGRNTNKTGNPVPPQLRTYPEYFDNLYSQGPLSLTNFRTGSGFDRVVEGLGAEAPDRFVEDYRQFSSTKVYDPANWQKDAQYQGIMGGGGGGWGGEIALLQTKAKRLTLLAFGGGGGGGLTSLRDPFGDGPSSVLGGGGGGGMTFGNGYRFGNRSYTGLGLGAGAGSDETEVQYSYNDYPGSGRPPRPAHRYNPAVIAEYQTQLKNLEQQLKTKFGEGETILLTGGGGMGGGVEYLMQDGEEYVPHALSTQGGFQFSYEFQGPKTPTSNQQKDLANFYARQEDLYEILGDAYREANRQSFEECGRDYSNYACMCPRTHAIVLCLVGQELGAGAEIPSWLQEQHCPNDTEAAQWSENGLTSYQNLLLDTTSGLTVPVLTGAKKNKKEPCTNILLDYFTSVNSTVEAP